MLKLGGSALELPYAKIGLRCELLKMCEYLKMQDNEVKHHEAEQRFEIGANNALAVLEYTLQNDSIVFTHTFVPVSLRGGGIANRLVAAGIAHARSHNLRVVPQCSYVAAWLARHPEQ